MGGAVVTPDETEPDPELEAETLEMEEEFPRWLAACDEQLAAGATVASLDQVGAPESLRPRLERAAAWCQSVRRMWPHAAGFVRDPSTDAPGDAAPFSEPMPARFGRFLIRRELGRGAFGVVSLAYDAHLRREVALKVPRAEVVVTPELRARFRHEAMAAAGLDHPNIVPVYEAGEEDSVCFIASAYCPGMTLAAWLRRRTAPVPYPQAAELVATLAEAVEHAHRRGVLHRDLKPSNVLLEEPAPDGPAADGSELVPRVTDFGLAKLLDAWQAEDGGANPTVSGVILGTPNYMAPEQADGRAGAVGPAADIYSLGVILYEVLTGRPPFQEDSALETLVLVRTQDPLPPSRLRPRLPRDLETICLKCLNKQPQARYPTALALAEDLRRFLAALPIRARPTPAWERGIKWMRASPALTALVGAGALAVLTLSAVIGLANIRLQRERDRAEARRREAVANLRKACDAVDRMLTRVSTERLKDIPQVEPVQRALLEDALEFYRDFARQAHDDPEVLLETSLAYGRLGRTYTWFARLDAAEPCFREAIALQQKLADTFPTVSTYRKELARSHIDLAGTCNKARRYSDAVDAIQNALDLLEKLAAAEPNDPSTRVGQAMAYGTRATIDEDLNQVRVAEAGYRKVPGPAYRRGAGCTIPHGPELSDPGAAKARNNLAAFLELSGGQLDEAERLYRHILGLWEGLAAGDPSNLEYRSRVALSLDNLSAVLAKTGRNLEAEKALRRTVELRAALTKVFPDTQHHFTKLGQAFSALAKLVTLRGDLGEARRLQEQEIASTRAALAVAPQNAELLHYAQGACSELIETLIRSGEHEGAAKTVAELVALSPGSGPESLRRRLVPGALRAPGGSRHPPRRQPGRGPGQGLRRPGG